MSGVRHPGSVRNRKKLFNNTKPIIMSKRLFFLGLWLLAAWGARGQGFRIEPFIGATASFAGGELIDYYKSFHSLSESGTEFKGAIQPLPMGTAGVQLRYHHFDSGILENLSASVGLQYLQKGFINQFRMEHNAPTNYTDLNDYREVYRHHYLTIPVQVRWGQKWFATLGLSFSQHINTSRTQRLERAQSGAGAVNNGFDQITKEKKKVAETAIQKSVTDFILGGGYQFSEDVAIAARANFGGQVFTEGFRNYGPIMLELSFFKSFNLK